jgi:HlyD family secretion protein
MSDSKTQTQKPKAQARSYWLAGGAGIVVLVVLVFVGFRSINGAKDAGADVATFTVQQGPLTISVLEAGTIKAREQIIIKNELEGRTQILTLIEEGTRVKKGDLLVELDGAALTDSKIDQEIVAMGAEALYIGAKEGLDVIKNQAQSDIDLAELTLKFAKQDLEQYEQGLYLNEKTAAQNEITLAEEELTRAEETLRWSERLVEEKYISQTEFQGDKLARNRTRFKVDLAKNNMKLLTEFTHNRQIAQLESDVKQAGMALERAQAKARADVIQAEADLKATEAKYNREQAKLDKIVDQLSKTTILAPADGLAIYATTAQRGHWRGSNEPLDKGQEVHERQELIYLPTADSSRVEVDIHEASLKKLQPGLPAVITVGAMPDEEFLGELERIAPLPDSQSMWMNPDLKVYNADIMIDGDTPNLRTGMSCKVEIIVSQLENVMYAPIHAVITVDGQPTVYVIQDNEEVPRPVEIGLDNNRMVHIISGVQPGELVSLTPPLQSGEMDRGGARNGADKTNGAKDRMGRKIRERLDRNGSTPGNSPAQGPGGKNKARGPQGN